MRDFSFRWALALVCLGVGLWPQAAAAQYVLSDSSSRTAKSEVI